MTDHTHDRAAALGGCLNVLEDYAGVRLVELPADQIRDILEGLDAALDAACDLCWRGIVH